MAVLKQSTAYTRMFLMVDSSDHITGATSKTVTLTLSKAGGSFGAAGGSVTEVSSGWYKVSLNTTDTGTLGDLAFHATATGCDPTDFVDQVTAQILGDTLTANVTQFGGSNGTFSGGRAEVNTTHFAGQTVTAAAGVTLPATVASTTNITAGTITTTTNLTNLPSITSNWLTAAGLASDAVTEIQSGLSTLDAAGVRTAVGLGSANLDTQLSGIQSDTNDIQSRIPAALSSGNMKCDVLAINTSTSAASTLAAFESGAIVSDTVATSPTSGGQFSGSNSLSSTNDHYNGQKMAFTSGANAGLWRIISDYVGATREFQFNGGTGALDAPFPSTPTATDAFQIGGP